MWKLSHHSKTGIAASFLVLSGGAHAQDNTSVHGQPILVPSQSSVYNQNSVFLPTPPTVSGQDVVRSADGGSCQTSISSGGPYMDFGVIGSEDFYDRSTAALYGRLVVPLGKRAKRVDCTRLYELEISRMRMEIELLRMGTMMPTQAAAHSEQELQSVSPAPEETPPHGAQVDFTEVNEGPAPLIHPMELVPTPSNARSLDAALAAVAASPPSVKPQKKRETVDADTYFVQIGYFSTPARASAALQGRNLDEPSEVRLHDTGTDIFFRALIGPYSQERAHRACERMVPCFVISG